MFNIPHLANSPYILRLSKCATIYDKEHDTELLSYTFRYFLYVMVVKSVVNKFASNCATNVKVRIYANIYLHQQASSYIHSFKVHSFNTYEHVCEVQHLS